MPNRYRGANDELRNALARVAPGTPLRDGIDRVVRAKAGALLVIDDEGRAGLIDQRPLPIGIVTWAPGGAS